jgi:2-oxoglutarate dehydrogenase E1 component
LDKERTELGVQDSVALIRIEQLYPFAESQIQQILSTYPEAQEFYWVQEEPANMGAWTFIRHRLEKLVGQVTYCGRRDAGTTAEGYTKVHEKEQKRILTEALSVSEKAEKKAKKR